jgi:hypothetical protein
MHARLPEAHEVMARICLRGLVILLGGLVVLFGWPGESRAQSMSYCVYTDAWHSSDAAYVYGYSQYDECGGCSGYPTSQFTTLYGPSGSAWSPGSSTALANGEGDWSVLGDFEIYCTCGGHYMYTGGGFGFGVYPAWSYWQYPYAAGGGVCIYQWLACSSGYATCGSGTMASVQMHYPCTWYKGALHWVLHWGYGRTCTLGISWDASGPGHCT